MEATLPQRPSNAAVWLAATRPKTLTAAVAPVAAGAAAAMQQGEWNGLALAAALFGSIAIQIGTNLANDVFDFEKGADTAERLGPVRVTQAGWLSPTAVRAAMVASFAAAFLAGIYLVALGGWPIVIIGLLSIASGIAYTGGPWPLGYHGLGDVFVFVFFGPVATTGTALVMTGQFVTDAFWAGIPAGAIAAAILVVNNLRDAATDVKAGKRTLAVRFGLGFARTEYTGLIAAAYLAVIGMALAGPRPALLLPLLSLPLAMKLVRRVRNTSGGALNPLLGQTAGLLLVFCVLLAVGFMFI